MWCRGALRQRGASPKSLAACWALAVRTRISPNRLRKTLRLTETGSVLIRGFQDVSREWLELMQERLRKNAEGMRKLAQCRTLPDFAAVQSDLARDNLNQIIDLTRRVAERSMQVAEEAAKTITAETGKSTGRLPRAA